MSSEEIIKSIQEITKNPYVITSLYSAITYSAVIVSGKLAMSYKLKKENKVENCKVIYETDALKVIRKERTNSMQKELEDLIYEGLMRLSFDISPESMQIIIKNLTSMIDKSNYMNSIRQCFFGTCGMYFPSDHSIRINKLSFLNTNLQKNSALKKQIISHELMHAASGYKYKKILASGFAQSSSIDDGINEGYTDLISQRYFCKEIQETVGYCYHKAVSEITEFIIGKQKMLDLYFHSDLKGLIGELSKYQSEEKVKLFILDLDTILKAKKVDQ
ncbi:MAG: hypothetical protein ACI31S_06715 [Bacilli bacterium]